MSSPEPDTTHATGASRPVGRPPGRTPTGLRTKRKLYRVALDLFARHGFEPTTLRQIAAAADVSPGLLYRYYPDKDALLVQLYAELSEQFATRTATLGDEPAHHRALTCLRESLAVLAPHRQTLRAMTSVLLTSPDRGLFAPATAFSRDRVLGAFVRAFTQSCDLGASSLAPALGRLVYLGHLGVVLLWLLDHDDPPTASEQLIALIERRSGLLPLLLMLPGTRTIVEQLDRICSSALGLESAAGSCE